MYIFRKSKRCWIGLTIIIVFIILAGIGLALGVGLGLFRGKLSMDINYGQQAPLYQNSQMSSTPVMGIWQKNKKLKKITKF